MHAYVQNYPQMRSPTLAKSAHVREQKAPIIAAKPPKQKHNVHIVPMHGSFVSTLRMGSSFFFGHPEPT